VGLLRYRDGLNGMLSNGGKTEIRFNISKCEMTNCSLSDEGKTKIRFHIRKCKMTLQSKRRGKD
jgi:hypothetical protein